VRTDVPREADGLACWLAQQRGGIVSAELPELIASFLASDSPISTTLTSSPRSRCLGSSRRSDFHFHRTCPGRSDGAGESASAAPRDQRATLLTVMLRSQQVSWRPRAVST
jgi:hypothetical protein